MLRNRSVAHVLQVHALMPSTPFVKVLLIFCRVLGKRLTNHPLELTVKTYSVYIIKNENTLQL